MYLVQVHISNINYVENYKVTGILGQDFNFTEQVLEAKTAKLKGTTKLPNEQTIVDKIAQVLEAKLDKFEATVYVLCIDLIEYNSTTIGGNDV